MRRCLKSKSPTSKSATRRVMLAVGIGLLAGAAGAAVAAGADEPALRFYNSPAVAAAKPPFSQAVRVGDALYLSGSIGIVPGTRQLAPGGIDAEARQTMENIGAVLKANGLSFGDVFKCTAMLADMSNWEAFNKVYVTYFEPGRLPARSAFGASALALGAQLELECWAYAGKR
jgi:2-iminobutanoate/2-iminopropanoate deaminase